MCWRGRWWEKCCRKGQLGVFTAGRWLSLGKRRCRPPLTTRAPSHYANKQINHHGNSHRLRWHHKQHSSTKAISGHGTHVTGAKKRIFAASNFMAAAAANRINQDHNHLARPVGHRWRWQQPICFLICRRFIAARWLFNLAGRVRLFLARERRPLDGVGLFVFFFFLNWNSTF